jgi:hypothetical protein
MAPVSASADQLAVEQREGETGYVAVEELSYETIIDASDGYAAELRVRVALHNGSESDRDVVHSIALPFASQVTGIAVARDGVWTPGRATTRVDEPGRRDRRVRHRAVGHDPSRAHRAHLSKAARRTLGARSAGTRRQQHLAGQ